MGTCLRPSWTAIVCPTISGVTVERRDHVLMTFRSPDAFMASTLMRRWSSTNGPFFRLRGIGYLPREPRRRRRRRMMSLSDGLSLRRGGGSGVPPPPPGGGPPAPPPPPPPP